VWDRPDRDVGAPDAGSAVESALASMWASVLGLDRVGLDDDFFELGGDSLQAARIAARATAEWKLSIPARTLLEAPTVASMAKTVVAALARSGRDEDEPPRSRARRPDAGRRFTCAATRDMLPRAFASMHPTGAADAQ
jgi:acyl carrier protein